MRRGKHATFRSQVDFATSALQPRIATPPKSLQSTQSIQLDRVRGQACAHLGQSCSIRATNHARRWPPGPKFRRARLPPLMHNVLTRVAFCARFVSTPTAAPSCLPWQASRPSVACLFGEFFNANSAHNTRPYGADTLATSCQHRLVLMCGLCYSVCIPFVPAIRQQLQVLKKK